MRIGLAKFAMEIVAAVGLALVAIGIYACLALCSGCSRGPVAAQDTELREANSALENEIVELREALQRAENRLIRRPNLIISAYWMTDRSTGEPYIGWSFEGTNSGDINLKSVTNLQQFIITIK